MRPVIGITAGYDEEKGIVTCPITYVNAVLEGGGKPVLIPVMPDQTAEEMLSAVDGLLFPGGADVDPVRYGERPNLHLGKIVPLLDSLELCLAKKALDSNIPILGICRGCQLVSVAAGGTLVQDIPTQVGGAMKHNQQASRWHGTHEVVLDQDSLVSKVFGARRLVVNSFHHQCVKSPGEMLTVTGRALDGVAEALESRKGFVLLLQWHPECMWTKNRVFLEPFKALCRAAMGQQTVEPQS